MKRISEIHFRRRARMLGIPVTGTVILLVGVLVNRASPDFDTSIHDANVQKVFSDFPSRLIGTESLWLDVGEVPIPSGQARLLGLNASVSRKFRRISSGRNIEANLYFAHVSDSRTMDGHTPTVCYPANGWFLDEEAPSIVKVDRGDERPLVASVYRFYRSDSQSLEEQIPLIVISGFLFPDGRNEAVMPKQMLGVSVQGFDPRLGLAQYQIVIRGRYTDSEAVGFFEEVMKSVPSEIIEAVRILPDRIEGTDVGGNHD